ncbi:511b7491-01e6-47af-8323-e6683eee87cd [Sclerotinia trifoliorum]|uniref:511b7491-01e6-47af-8323-e6683eee87cd n=1 Tax=Sclerotinia trifoliorum TaxID=28548 RepID=A0A8H2W1L8_9HELO|nr:511b7491-01e6-47af-8323-e6683eee87cd [Sclerotinia trifoliorum]
MVEVVSIIIAVVSLLGSLAAAGFTGWISYYLDQAKQRKATKALIHKYRDPLTLAAYDLQSRIWGLVNRLLDYYDDEEKQENIYVYTAFLIGQYLSWTYILRRQAQFMQFSTEQKNQQLNKILDAVTEHFSLDRYEGEASFMLWRGQQMAIGEIMTKEEEGQLYCMGFAAFSKKYHGDPEFKKWFAPIERGVNLLVAARKRHDPAATYRLRRLQHLMIDLVTLLEFHRATNEPDKQMKVDAAPECKCDNCPGPRVANPDEKLPV